MSKFGRSGEIKRGILRTEIIRGPECVKKGNALERLFGVFAGDCVAENTAWKAEDQRETYVGQQARSKEGISRGIVPTDKEDSKKQKQRTQCAEEGSLRKERKEPRGNALGSGRVGAGGPHGRKGMLESFEKKRTTF